MDMVQVRAEVIAVRPVEKRGGLGFRDCEYVIPVTFRRCSAGFILGYIVEREAYILIIDEALKSELNPVARMLLCVNIGNDTGRVSAPWASTSRIIQRDITLQLHSYSAEERFTNLKL